MIKKSVSFALCAVLILTCVMSGCSFNDTSTAMGRIKSNGKIVVAMSPDYPPFSFIDTQNLDDENLKYAGIDCRLMEYIAKELGVKLEMKPVEFEKVLTTAESGGCDIVVSGLTADSKRAYLTYTSPYYTAGEIGILVSSKNKDKIKTMDNLENKTVGIVAKTLSTKDRQNLKGAKVKEFRSIEDALAQLKSGGVSAIALPKTTGMIFDGNEYSLTDISVAPGTDKIVVGIVNNKDKNGVKELSDKLEEIIQKAKSEGLIDKWLAEAIQSAKKINEQPAEKDDGSSSSSSGKK